MTVIAENKAATKSSSTRRSRAGASIANSGSPSKTHKSKSEAIKTSSKELFEGRLGLMSSLRKGLTR